MDIRKLLVDDEAIADSVVAHRGGSYTARRYSYTYFSKYTSADLANDIRNALPNATILSAEDKFSTTKRCMVVRFTVA